MKTWILGALAATALASAAGAATLPPLAAGDEPIVVTQHVIKTARGPLAYEARAGRIPIRNAETGEVRGWVFFTAYVVKPPPGAKPRPLTFAWNGGPTGPAVLVQTELLGPRRIEGDKFVDNVRTLFVSLYGEQLKKPHSTIVECHDFFSAIVKGKLPNPNFEDGLLTELVADALLRSGQTGP